VLLHVNDGQSVETAARNTRMSRRTLTRFLAHVEVTGEVHYAPEMGKTHADSFLKWPNLCSAVLFAVEQCPEAFLEEISAFVTNLHQLLREDEVISLPFVSRILAANGLTRTVIETAFTPRNELDRARWVLDQWDIPLRARVFVDEAHRCGRSVDRKWAWSLRGHRAECYLTNSRRMSTSFFVAMSHERVLDWKMTQPPPARPPLTVLRIALEIVLPHMNAYGPALPWSKQAKRVQPSERPELCPPHRGAHMRLYKKHAEF